MSETNYSSNPDIIIGSAPNSDALDAVLDDKMSPEILEGQVGMSLTDGHA